MADVLYTTEKECAVCHQPFSVTRTRNRLTVVKHDTDFCTYYREVNPYYYSIWVCPHCGYAASENNYGGLSASVEDKIKSFLANREVHVDYSGVRNREQAIETFKLAIFFGEIAQSPASRLGGLCLRLAWLYREGEQEQEEQLALTKAAEYYDTALLKERLPIGNMSEVTLTYLIGELYHRTGELDKALLYLGKVVGNPAAKQERHVLDMARDVWHEVREQKKQTETMEPSNASEKP